MKISRKSRYALQALTEMALRAPDETVSVHQITAYRDIPARFLEAIMRQLRQAGILDSVRGKSGGFRLTRPACEISVGEIVELFEGAFPGYEARGDPDIDPVWDRAARALNEVLNTSSLADLAEAARSRRTAGDYMI